MIFWSLAFLAGIIAWDMRATLLDAIRDAYRHDAPPSPDPLDELAHFWPRPERLEYKRWRA